MSINDYLNQEIPEIAAIIFLIFLPVMIALCVIVYKKSNQKIYGNNSGEIRIEKNVIVISKNIVPNPVNPKFMINTILFELENKQRLEFAIKDYSVYGKIINGDKGNLKFQGKRFISFETAD